MNKRVYLYPGLGEGEPHYLDRLGTIKDLAETGLTLTEGMKIGFWMDDADDHDREDNLLFDGTVHYDAQRQQWYALIDSASFRHESDERPSQSDDERLP